MERALEPVLLTTFLAVLDAGRVSGAARALHLSQPAVTAQLRRLEDTVGTALFVRSAQGVQPTEAGRALEGYARTVRQTLEDALGAVSGARAATGTLRLGASTTTAAHVLPGLLARFRARHPGVALEVDVGNTAHVVAAIRDGRLPLGLVEGHARAAGVRLVAYLDDEIVPVVGRDSPWAPRAAKDLERMPLLWRERGSGTRAVVERALARAGVQRTAIRARDIELGSTEAIVGGALAGLGVAFVSRVSVDVHLAAGLVRVAAGLELAVRRTFSWALPSGGLHGTAAAFHALAGGA